MSSVGSLCTIFIGIFEGVSDELCPVMLTNADHFERLYPYAAVQCDLQDFVKILERVAGHAP